MILRSISKKYFIYSIKISDLKMYYTIIYYIQYLKKVKKNRIVFIIRFFYINIYGILI